ncbi:MAG: hypothetical protein H7308_06000 [Chthonomonadaceae bacterium]|nr:hypothetical protein [Chthonomonadaceae bacterium]
MEPEKQSMTIEFVGVSLAEANRFASELSQSLQGLPEVEVEQRRGSENTQDMGATLVLLFGTPAILAIAKGIQTYLSKRHDAKITIKGPQGEVRAENITSQDAITLAEVFKSSAPPSEK